MALQSYRELEAWQRAIGLVEHVYRLSGAWPPEERYGLTSQVRRAAVSIAANLAEGAGRRTTGEFIQFAGISRGSLAETETLLIIAVRLNYIDPDLSDRILAEIAAIRMMLAKLVAALQARASSNQARTRASRTTDHGPR